MFPDASHSAQSLPPTKFGKVKPSGVQDVVWGRPVFRAPDLSPPQLAFLPLPLRGQFWSGHRPVAAP
jgi:hypothetical protein